MCLTDTDPGLDLDLELAEDERPAGEPPVDGRYAGVAWGLAGTRTGTHVETDAEADVEAAPSR